MHGHITAGADFMRKGRLAGAAAALTMPSLAPLWREPDPEIIMPALLTLAQRRMQRQPAAVSAVSRPGAVASIALVGAAVLLLWLLAVLLRR